MRKDFNKFYKSYDELLLVKDLVLDNEWEDYFRSRKFIYYLDKKGYIRVHEAGYRFDKGSKSPTFYHRIITKCQDDKVVDHIDGNLLNNRLKNLRVCTHSINIINRRISTNKSGTPGVCFDKHANKWVGSIIFNGKRIRKKFKNKEDAIKFRKLNELKILGFNINKDAM